ncbi:MAG: sodium-independent anion transporter, partial [Candidatus Puniceispirillum sp.]
MPNPFFHGIAKMLGMPAMTDADSNPSSTVFTPMQAKTEILSGLTVALALVPEAIAFAFVAGVA